MTGVRIGVVGGSIAGCAAGAALTRAGFHVTILERSTRRLEERGSGVVLSAVTLTLLKERDLVDADFAGLPLNGREWRSSDGRPTGRLAFREPLVGEAHHWGGLYRQLRKRVCEDDYRPGSTVRSVQTEAGGGGVRVSCKDGSTHDFDLLVGADGYRSSVRRLTAPGAEPQYAGYPAWRGLVDEGALADPEFAEGAVQMVGIPRGQLAIYMVPGFDGETTPGRRRLNWLVYDATVPQELLGAHDDGSQRVVVDGVAPGRLNDAQLAHLRTLAARHLPPWHREVVLSTPDPYLQTLYDLSLNSYVHGRTCLVGDAATIARPHTASGTSKAIQDAATLCDALVEGGSINEGLLAYHRARSDSGNALVQLGKDLGYEQVVNAPAWLDLDEQGYAALLLGGAARRTHFAGAAPAVALQPRPVL